MEIFCGLLKLSWALDTVSIVTNGQVSATLRYTGEDGDAGRLFPAVAPKHLQEAWREV